MRVLAVVVLALVVACSQVAPLEPEPPRVRDFTVVSKSLHPSRPVVVVTFMYAGLARETFIPVLAEWGHCLVPIGEVLPADCR